MKKNPPAYAKNSSLLGRFLLALLLLAGWVPAAWSQTSPVTISPASFTDTTPITHTFDATLGSGGLANYPGDVYIYTGVITSLSPSNSNWRYVVNPNFSAPVAAERMTRLGNNRYSISFTPRSYYPGLSSSSEVVQKLVMVFRGANGTPEGKGPSNADILVNVAPQPTPGGVAALPAGAKADGITYINNGTSAILSLTAPNKNSVHVIGDFNNWQVTSAGQLHKTSTVNSDPTTGRWWVQVNGLTPGTEYAYQFLIDGQLRIADPYCEKILDPNSDQYIPTVTYPNLKPYPTGRTTGIVSVLQSNPPAYNWTATNFQRPARTNLVVYELHLRDFIARHDYATLTDTLKYLQRLSVNAIELLPVNEFENNNSWGYNPSFYFAPDKYYGTQNALKRFIDECHRRGIAVVLDMVLNHSCDASPMVQLYRDASGPTANNPWYNRTARHPFNVCNDFNHESQYTKYFTKQVIKFWLQNYRIDGYRFDLSKGFTQVDSGTDVERWGFFDQSRINIWQDYYNAQMSVDNASYPILEHFAVN
ncbi:MAG: 1,4-alpha-glucan-branching protein, partial [Hymenobacter sp.]|nr:1,4-alpha-glucan-branching protein [Hymenobacter sp.]